METTEEMNAPPPPTKENLLANQPESEKPDSASKEQTQSRKRISLILPAELIQRIDSEAARYYSSRQAVIEKTLQSRFSAECEAQNMVLIARYLKNLDARWQTTNEHLNILSESFALYLRMWLSHASHDMGTYEQQQERRLQAGKMFERFIDKLLTRIADGETLKTQLAEANRKRAGENTQQ